VTASPGAATANEALLRRALFALAALSILATAVELAAERHWETFVQRIPWFALVIAAAALVLAATASAPGAIRAARLLAAVIAVFALIGVFKHVEANRESGPLDFRYSTTWDSMSPSSQWWKAASGAVGPSPVIAPLALANSAALIAAATLRHPALGRR